MDESKLSEVLAPYGRLPNATMPAVELTVRPLSGGLINDTYSLGDNHILQRLHPIFGAKVNDDIAALVPPLLARGVPVPNIMRTRDGLTHVTSDTEGLEGTWRILSRVEGQTHHAVSSAAQARAAAAMVGRFHTALLDADHEFHFSRGGVHDTPKHMAALASSLEACRDHRLYDDVAALAEQVTKAWDAWGDPPELPARIIHGDPKISNLLFDADMNVTGVIDLDTMAWSSVDLEIGDAVRSWCASSDENSDEVTCRMGIFEATVEAYLGEVSDWIQPAEIAALAGAGERITLELSARFLSDALRETYFGWDPSVAPTRGDHNLLRARGQVSLALDMAGKRAAMERIVSAIKV